MDPQHKKDVSPLEQSQRKTMKMIRDPEHLSYEDRLRMQEMFSLGKKRGDLGEGFYYLKGACRTAGEGLFVQRHVVIGQGRKALN